PMQLNSAATNQIVPFLAIRRSIAKKRVVSDKCHATHHSLVTSHCSLPLRCFVAVDSRGLFLENFLAQAVRFHPCLEDDIADGDALDADAIDGIGPGSQLGQRLKVDMLAIDLELHSLRCLGPQ